MDITKYIWIDGSFVLWNEARIHVLTHTLHYGAGTFEGIRCYSTDRGPAVFRLAEHIERLYRSARLLKMNVAQTEEQTRAIILELIRKNEVNACYIRPVIFFGSGKMGLNPKGASVSFSIACWPWGAYLPYEMVDVKISKFIRIHPRSTFSDAKICGHYVNSIVAAQELDGTRYHEALLLDYEGNIAEGPGENFFMVKNGVLITPKLGSILPGITRDAILQIAKKFSIMTEERPISVEEALAADESFFTGTAAEVTPVRSINDKVIGTGTVGPITNKLKNTFNEVVVGKNKDFLHFLTFTNG